MPSQARKSKASSWGNPWEPWDKRRSTERPSKRATAKRPGPKKD